MFILMPIEDDLESERKTKIDELSKLVDKKELKYLDDLIEDWLKESLSYRPGIVNYAGGWEHWVQRDFISWLLLNWPSTVSYDTEFIYPENNQGEMERDSPFYGDKSCYEKLKKTFIADWVFNVKVPDEKLAGEIPRLLVELKVFGSDRNAENMAKEFRCDVLKLLSARMDTSWTQGDYVKNTIGQKRKRDETVRKQFGIALYFVPFWNDVTQNQKSSTTISTAIELVENLITIDDDSRVSIISSYAYDLDKEIVEKYRLQGGAIGDIPDAVVVIIVKVFFSDKTSRKTKKSD